VKRFLPALILSLITAAAVGFIYKDKLLAKLGGEATTAEEKAPAFGHRGGHGAGTDRPVSILARAAETAAVPVYLYGVGTVGAYNKATVRAQVGGRLISVEFQEGQTVKKGDVLARIDPAHYQAAYDQAAAKKVMNEAALENALADLKRLETLAKSNYTSEQAADAQRAKVAQLRAQIRQDEAAIESARTDLEYTVIRAPIDGRTGIREVDVGNLVTPGDAGGIATIAQLQPISVVFTLPEIHISELIEAKAAGRVGLRASVGGKTIGEGALEVIDNMIDQNTGTIRLKGTFPNRPITLWPGQFVNVRLHLKTLEDATVVPSAAVQQGVSGQFVYRIEPDRTVKLTPVEIAREDEDWAVVALGIQADDKVAVSGFANLKDGAKVVVDDTQGTGTAPEGKAPATPEGTSGSGDGRTTTGTQSGEGERLKAAQRETGQ
jgi:multidrug efflux system membrane fusion protein